eukprot:6211901-Pleurochrysis_carterae.AAC.1
MQIKNAAKLCGGNTHREAQAGANQRGASCTSFGAAAPRANNALRRFEALERISCAAAAGQLFGGQQPCAWACSVGSASQGLSGVVTAGPSAHEPGKAMQFVRTRDPQTTPAAEDRRARGWRQSHLSRFLRN